MTTPTPDPNPTRGLAPVYKVTRPASGEIVHPGAHVYRPGGPPAILRYATRPTVPGKSGKVVVGTAPGADAEVYAGPYGLAVTRVIPEHDDPVTGRWCGFGGCDSLTGICLLHD
jgi:hypothetical protein